MKKLFFLTLIFLGFALNTYADAWDNLTKSEAKEVIKYLKKNPFVFDYCDCCDSEGTVQLIQIKKMKIVPCDWSKEHYSIEYEGIAIASFPTSDKGVDYLKPSKMNQIVSKKKIYMNYTWAPVKNRKEFGPIFQSVIYNYYGADHKTCLPVFSIPKADAIENKKYSKWYQKNTNS